MFQSKAIRRVILQRGAYTGSSLPHEIVYPRVSKYSRNVAPQPPRCWVCTQVGPQLCRCPPLQSGGEYYESRNRERLGNHVFTTTHKSAMSSQLSTWFFNLYIVVIKLSGKVVLGNEMCRWILLASLAVSPCFSVFMLS